MGLCIETQMLGKWFHYRPCTLTSIILEFENFPIEKHWKEKLEIKSQLPWAHFWSVHSYSSGRIMYKWLKWIGDWKWSRTIFKFCHRKASLAKWCTHEYIILSEFQPPSHFRLNCKICLFIFPIHLHSFSLQFTLVICIWSVPCSVCKICRNTH